MKGKKTGGRVKGTPNKITASQTRQVADFLDRYKSGQLVDFKGDPISLDSDFGRLTPSDRVMVAARLQGLITPKPIEIDLNTEATLTIEDKLAILAEENDH